MISNRFNRFNVIRLQRAIFKLVQLAVKRHLSVSDFGAAIITTEDVKNNGEHI